MLDRLPELIDPILFAERRSELKGQVEIRALGRLSDILISDVGKVNIDFAFFKEGRLLALHGQIKADLSLKCQNCLEAVNWPVDSTFKLGIVSTLDEVNRLPEEYEPLLVGEDKIPLTEIVEEELLLCLPVFPKHQQCCINYDQVHAEKPAQKNAQSTSDNPFSVLAKLKNTGDK